MENNLRRHCINGVVALALHFSSKLTELTVNFLLNVSFSERGLWKTVTELCHQHKSDLHGKYFAYHCCCCGDVFWKKTI